MSEYKQFGNLLDQYLARADRSGAWLAQRLGVNPGTVTRWRNGDNRPYTPEMVVGIADTLHVYGQAERRALLYTAGYAYLERDIMCNMGESEMARGVATDTGRGGPPGGDKVGVGNNSVAELADLLSSPVEQVCDQKGISSERSPLVFSNALPLLPAMQLALALLLVALGSLQVVVLRRHQQCVDRRTRHQ